jgi:predicted RNA-binding protein with PUA-like domain
MTIKNTQFSVTWETWQSKVEEVRSLTEKLAKQEARVKELEKALEVFKKCTLSVEPVKTENYPLYHISNS